MEDATDPYVAHAEVSVRSPRQDLFDAFVQPDTLCRFWLDSASGPLAPGAKVRWDFMVPGATAEVEVREFEPPSRLAFDWSDGTYVDLRFSELGPHESLVTVHNGGFAGTTEEKVAQVLEATQGFTIVLCDLKLLLETGHSPELASDKAALISRSRT